MIKYEHMRAKIRCLCAHVGYDEDQFVTLIVAETGLRASVVRHWLEDETLSLRKSRFKFLNFWHSRNIPIDLTDFGSSLEAFQGKLARLKTPSPPRNPWSSPPPQTAVDALELAGRYQIIRPHAVYNNAYVLEALEIEFNDGQYTTLSFSHHRVDNTYLYEGHGFAEKRYFYTLMSRRHEEFEGYQSHRALSFHIEEPRLKSCISGVMLRGVAGKAGREAIALPFIAMRVKACTSLRQIEPQQLPLPFADDLQTESLTRLHPQSYILVGLVRTGSCRSLYDICHGIFDDKDFKTATCKSNGMALWTVPKGTLQDIQVIGEKRWSDAIDSVAQSPDSDPGYTGA